MTVKKPGGHGSWKEEKVVVDVANQTVTATKDEIDFDDDDVANTAAEEVKYKIAANTAHTVPKPGEVHQTRRDTMGPIPGEPDYKSPSSA